MFALTPGARPSNPSPRSAAMRIFVGGKDEAVEAMNTRPLDAAETSHNAGRAYKPRWQEESMFQVRFAHKRARLSA